MNRPDFSVANLGELATLYTAEIAEGANVWVAADGAYWTLEKNSGAPVGAGVVAPGAGAPTAGATNARWLREVGASQVVAAALGSRAGQRVDLNSLVCGALDLSTWQACQPTLAPVVRPLSGVAASGLRSLVAVNAESNTPSGGYIERPFTVPAGVTAVVFEIDEVALYTGDGSTGAAALQLYDGSGLNQLSSTAFTPTGTPTMVASAAISVTAGTEYRVRLATAVGGMQSRFLCARIRVRPSASSDPFWLAFQRIEVDASNLQGNDRRGRANPRFAAASSLSFVDLMTSAPELRAELYDSNARVVGAGYSVASVAVNGYPFSTLTPSPNAVSYQASVLPVGLPSPRRVRVTSGTQNIGGTFGDGLQIDTSGLFLAAIYAASSAYLEATPATVKRAVVYGDSKTAGQLASIPSATSYAEALRQHGWDVSVMAIGSNTLVADVGATLSVAACASWAQTLLQYQPNLIVLAIGRNDFAAGALSPANLVTQIGNLADAIHAADPKCIVAIMPFTHETTESAVSAVAWNTERLNEAALVTSRAPWAILADAGGLWTSAQAGTTYTVDNVHPNDAGQSRQARMLETAVIPGSFDYPFRPADVSPTIWCESDVNLAGGAMGSTTSIGTSPPVVTFSGSPPIAGRLIVQIRTGGARGTATFDATFDAERSYQWRGLTTGASVSLPGLGTVAVAFAVGTYATDNFYYADSATGNWVDIVGGSVALVPNGTQTWFPSIDNRKPGLRLLTNAAGNYSVTGLNIPQPYSLVYVGKLDSQAQFAMIGRNHTNSGPILYMTAGGVASLWVNGSHVDTASVDGTKAHCYVAVANGASSSISLDGVTVAGTTTAQNITALSIGADQDLTLVGPGYCDAFAIIPRALSSDEIMCITSRMRAKYGTP